MTEDYERLQSLDKEGHRADFFVAEVHGFWRQRREWVQFILILFFLILPWTTINGQQSLLLHLERREFVFFGLTFYAHDAPLIFFILATLTLSLAFVTSVWGRIWCGWACPQTVFIDGVFRRIEKWTEGSHLQRRNLARAELSFKKIKIKFSKWFLFFLVSTIIAHSFLAYFVGARELLAMMENSPMDNWNYFLLVFSMTALILFNFGWFREQFCIIMCPYGRFQSVLLDEKSIHVFYDSKRGEPRKSSTLHLPAGDCVSCNRCVQVCPTRIDIRNGLQMECIACTACIDACDEIMQKVNKPQGLIRYAAQDGSSMQFWRPRTLVYLSLLLVLGVGLSWNILHRKNLHFTLLRATESPYSFSKNQTGDEIVINHFRLHLKNQSSQNLPLDFELIGPAWIHLTMAQNPFILLPNESNTVHLFVQFPREQSKNILVEPIKLKISQAKSPNEISIFVLPVVGPNG